MRTEEITLPRRLQQQPVANGSQKAVPIRPRQISVWGDHPVKAASLTVKLTRHSRNNKIPAPVHANQKVGELEVAGRGVKTIDNEPLTYNLYSKKGVPTGNFWQRLWH